MKKLILLMLIMITGVYGQLDINLAEYQQNSYQSKIVITNLGMESLHNVKIKIDSSPEFDIVDLLETAQSVFSVMNIPPGEHLITVTSKEITEEKTLLFSFTKEDVKEIKKKESQRENELAEIARKNEEQSIIKLDAAEQRNKNLGIQTKKDNSVLIFGIIGLIIGIGILVWLIKRRK